MSNHSKDFAGVQCQIGGFLNKVSNQSYATAASSDSYLDKAMLYPGGFITGIGADLSNSSADLYDPDKGATTKAGATFMIGLEVVSGGRGKAVRKVGQGGLNLFKHGQSNLIKKGGWRNGDYFLNLPNKFNSKLNWKQNYGALRSEMSKGNSIFDNYVDSKGGLIETSGFLNAERKALENKGWKYSKNSRSWNPPNKK